MYGSNFCSETLRPRALRSRPSDAAVIPLPSDETTPPVTNTYLTCLLTLAPSRIGDRLRDMHHTRRGRRARGSPLRSAASSDGAAGLRTGPAGAGTPCHPLAHALARRGTALADVGRQGGSLVGEVRASEHHVPRRIAHLGAVEHEPR